LHSFAPDERTSDESCSDTAGLAIERRNRHRVICRARRKRKCDSSSHRHPVRHYDFVGYVHSQSMYTTKLCEVRKDDAKRRAPDFPGLSATRHPPPMPSCVLCIGVESSPNNSSYTLSSPSLREDFPTPHTPSSIDETKCDFLRHLRIGPGDALMRLRPNRCNVARLSRALQGFRFADSRK
jgi:hypothetical protein